MELAHLKTFLTVARKGNLSAAARELATTQPNVGRQMTALSKEVGMDLFVRHSRGMDLTQQGKEFFDLCQRIVGRLEQETVLIREKNSALDGTLRVMTGMGSVEAILKKLSSFSQKFPKLRISFSSPANTLTVDIFQSSLDVQIGVVDVAFLPFMFPDPDLGHHEWDLFFKIYASPQYLEANGRPKILEDLCAHRLIAYNGEHQATFNRLILNKITQLPYAVPSLEVHNGTAMRMALLQGLGIGVYFYDRELVNHNLLVDVFPEIPGQKAPYYYIYHKRLENSPKIQAFQRLLEDIYDEYWKQPL